MEKPHPFLTMLGTFPSKKHIHRKWHGPGISHHDIYMACNAGEYIGSIGVDGGQVIEALFFLRL
jgi:hypothetical protein